MKNHTLNWVAIVAIGVAGCTVGNDPVPEGPKKPATANGFDSQASLAWNQAQQVNVYVVAYSRGSLEGVLVDIYYADYYEYWAAYYSSLAYDALYNQGNTDLFNIYLPYATYYMNTAFSYLNAARGDAGYQYIFRGLFAFIGDYFNQANSLAYSINTAISTYL
jgi:hypothetical protein